VLHWSTVAGGQRRQGSNRVRPEDHLAAPPSWTEPVVDRFDADIAVKRRQNQSRSVGRGPGRPAAGRRGPPRPSTQPERSSRPGFVDNPHPLRNGPGSAGTTCSSRPSNHGPWTTIVTGNCGVGFAPVEAQAKKIGLIGLNGKVLRTFPAAHSPRAISWGWESYPEYLDIIGRGQFAVDCGQPGSPRRGSPRLRDGVSAVPATSPASPEDNRGRWRALVQEAIEAGRA